MEDEKNNRLTDGGRGGNLVERQWPFVLPDFRGGVESVGVLGGGLQTHFDDICSGRRRILMSVGEEDCALCIVHCFLLGDA